MLRGSTLIQLYEHLNKSKYVISVADLIFALNHLRHNYDINDDLTIWNHFTGEVVIP